MHHLLGPGGAGARSSNCTPTAPPASTPGRARRRSRVALVDAAVGDVVLVHAGEAIAARASGAGSRRDPVDRAGRGSGCAGPGQRDRAGRGLPAVRVRRSPPAGPRPVTSATTPTGVVIEVEGRAAAVAAFVAALRRAPAAAGGGRGVAPRRARRRPATRVRHRGQRAGGGRTTLVSRGHRDLRGLPARAVRPGRPALRLPVHQLHATAGPGSPSCATCPTTARPRRWRASRCAPTAPRSTRDPADRRFHAQPVCCPTAGRAGARRLAGSPADAVRGRAAAPRCATGRRSRSRASAATTWRRAPPTSRAVARAAGAQAPRGQAVRGHGRRPRRGARAGRGRRRGAASVLTSRPAPIVLLPPAARRGRRAGGRAGQPASSA